MKSRCYRHVPATPHLYRACSGNMINDPLFRSTGTVKLYYSVSFNPLFRSSSPL